MTPRPPRHALLALLALAVLGTGCAQQTDGDAPPDPEPGAAAFPPGIHHLRPPVPGGGPARLVHLDGGLAASIDVLPVGYDLQPGRLLHGDSDRSLFVVTPDGVSRRVPVQGIHSIGRPTLSPDGRHAAVQALEGDARIGTPSEDLNIYVVDLETGASHRVSPLPINEESPVWIPGTRTVAYSSFDPEDGVHLHLVDADTGAAVRTLRDAGELHVRASDDGAWAVNGPQLRVVALADGAPVADLLDAALAGLRAAGFEPLPARGGNPDLAAFPLAADFSPDGTHLVFDGAVSRGGEEGVVVARMALDGSGFQVLTGLIPVDAGFGNDHNFSQVDPRWV